eukprot:gene6261-10269_t
MKTTEQNTFKEISKYFGYPLYEAAASLGMSVNEIKSICRNNDLKRWPYHTSKRVGQSPFIVNQVTFQQVSRHFGSPIYEAAACLGLSVTELKAICRQNNLKRWPYHRTKKITTSNSLYHVMTLKTQLEPQEKTQMYNSQISIQNAPEEVSTHNILLAFHISVHENDFKEFEQFTEIPFVYQENFEEKYPISQIFEYFFDKLLLVEGIFKLDPESKLVEIMIKYFEAFERGEVEFSFLKKFSSKISFSNVKNTEKVLEMKKQRLVEILKKKSFFIEQIWMKKIEEYPFNINKAPDFIKSNQKVIKLALKKSPKTLVVMDDKIRDSDEIAEFISENCKFLVGFMYLSPRLKMNKLYATRAVKLRPLYYASLPKELKEDKLLVLSMFHFNGTIDAKIQKKIPKSLFEDFEFLKNLLNFVEFVPSILPSHIKENRNLIKLSSTLHPFRLGTFHSKYQQDMEILEAVFSEPKNCCDSIFKYPPIYNDEKRTIELLKKAPGVISLMNPNFIDKQVVRIFLQRNRLISSNLIVK